jgi:soluble lytic murein transglycosylase
MTILTLVVITRGVVGKSQDGLQELRSLVVQTNGRPAEQELQRIESKHSGTRAGALARFLRGYLHCQGQNYQAAIAALEGPAIAETSAVGDYSSFYLAESRSKLGQAGAALREFTALYDNHQDSVHARTSRLRAAEMALALNDPDAATRVLAPLAAAGDAEARFLTAEAAAKKGEEEPAAALYRRVYYHNAASVVADRAAERLRALGSPIDEGAASFDELMSRAGAFFDSKQYAESGHAYGELLKRFPETSEADRFLLRRGISLLNSRQTADAAALLSKVGRRNDEVHAEALYHRSEALRRVGQAAQSSIALEQMLSLHPRSKWSAAALYNHAAYLAKQGREAEAAGRFRRLLSMYPSSEFAPEASYYLGWRAYASQQHAETARILEDHLLNYRSPASKFIGESAFWAGKSRERMGNFARALALYEAVIRRYPYGYHGHVARGRAAALRSAHPGLKPEEPRPGSEMERMRQNILYYEPVRETDDGVNSPVRLARADDLELIGLSELAIAELNEALERAPSSPRLNLRLAQTYSRKGENFQATLILRRGYPDIFSYPDADLPREAWEIFFPLRHWDLIKEESRRYGVDPFIVAGLIRQESVFNQTAISRVGARGLMQLMPATAQQIARKQNVAELTTADLYNPVLNIKLGMFYFSERLGQFGKIEYAAAAYNAGPGRAHQWLRERGSLDMEDWVERIPFSETRGYVQGVIRNAANYRRFYRE